MPPTLPRDTLGFLVSSVYDIRMAHTRIHLSDSPVEKTGSPGFDISDLAQDTASSAFCVSALDLWLEEVAALNPAAVAPAAIREAVTAAKDELELKY